jgi:hypothetical protein
MPCNASYARFIFGKFFTSTIILYVLLFAQKVLFFFCKKWVLQGSTISSSHKSNNSGMACVASFIFTPLPDIRVEPPIWPICTP